MYFLDTLSRSIISVARSIVVGIALDGWRRRRRVKRNLKNIGRGY